jgi:hypothetical protein
VLKRAAAGENVEIIGAMDAGTVASTSRWRTAPQRPSPSATRVVADLRVGAHHDRIYVDSTCGARPARCRADVQLLSSLRPLPHVSEHATGMPIMPRIESRVTTRRRS